MRHIGLALSLVFAAAAFGKPVEVPGLRGYNYRVYVADPKTRAGMTKKTYEFYAGHIHYKTDGGRFERIDLRPVWNGQSKQFIVNKASYRAKLPQYADGYVHFTNRFKGRNETLSAKPQAQHVAGEVQKNSVLYRNAFGEGIDLEIRCVWIGIREIVVIRQPIPGLLSDLSIRYTLNVPASARFRTGKMEWGRQGTLDLTGKAAQVGESYFSHASVWDSKGRRAPVKITLEKSGTGFLLTKTIPLAFLKQAAYPVFTDHATDFTAGAGDGYVGYEGWEPEDTWDSVHDATAGTTADYSTPPMVGGIYRINMYGIYRIFLPFDTSAIDDSETIETAQVRLWCGTPNTPPARLSYIVQGSQASTSELTTDDYDACGTTIGSDGIAPAAETGYNGTGFHYWTLNSVGKGWVNKKGYTKLCLRDANDISDTDPNDDWDNTYLLAQSEATTEIDMEEEGYWPVVPVLIVTTGSSTPPPPPPPPTIGTGRIFGTVKGDLQSSSDYLLILHGDGEDGGNTITDSSIYARTVTNSGMTTETEYYRFGTASIHSETTVAYLKTDASSDFEFPPWQSFTLHFWYYWTGSATDKDGIIRIRRTKPGCVDLVNVRFPASYFLVDLSKPDGIYGVSISSGLGLATNEWTHVAVVRDCENDIWRLFVNGKQRSTRRISDTLADWRIDDEIYVQIDGQPNFWVDEVVLVRGALWRQNFTPPTQETMP